MTFEIGLDPTGVRWKDTRLMQCCSACGPKGAHSNCPLFFLCVNVSDMSIFENSTHLVISLIDFYLCNATMF